MSCPYSINPNQSASISNHRDVEESIHTDFKDDMSYGDYLNLEKVLSAQHPLSDQHDEMLFIVIHQASELWIKLAGHELTEAISNIKNGDFGHAFKVISRVKQILGQLTQSWGILSTLTPVDYLKFRDTLGHSSGFQSYGYRKIEFLLGNKNAQLLKVHENDPSLSLFTEDDLKKIAQEKMSDLNTNDLDAAQKMVAGTARSMGINILD